jgi:glycosyltransferase 2 family protein
MKSRIGFAIRPLIGVAIFALASFLLYRALRHYSLAEIVAAVRAISLRHVAIALLFTAGSFVCLSLSDALAVRYTGKRLRYPRIALTSFTAVSIGHVLGFAALSSGALRYRFYSRWGFTHGDVARVLMFCGTTAAVGMATLGGLAAVLRPDLPAQLVVIGEGAVRGIGASLIAGVLGYLGLAASGWNEVRIRRFVLPVPSLKLAIGQVAVGTADMLCVSAVLHQMIAASANAPYLGVAAAYVSANVASVLAHVPGGLGVVEAVVLYVVPGAHVIGALVAFRAVYYLVPFALGCAALGLSELLLRKR